MSEVKSGFDSVFIDTEGKPIVDLNAVVLNSNNEQQIVYESKSGNAQKSQPIVTTSAAPGLVRFWANPGYYEVEVSDGQSPPRFSPRKIPFDAVAGDKTAGAEGILPSQIQLTSAVTTNMLQNDSVTADKLKDDASTDANRAVTRNHIRNLSIDESKLDANSVTTNKIANNQVTFSKLDSVAGSTCTGLNGFSGGLVRKFATNQVHLWGAIEAFSIVGPISVQNNGINIATVPNGFRPVGLTGFPVTIRKVGTGSVYTYYNGQYGFVDTNGVIFISYCPSLTASETLQVFVNTTWLTQ